MRAIDLLASEYGWTKDYILLSVYPDELILLGEQITKRVIDKILMDVKIAANPHTEEAAAKAFVQDLLDKRREIWGAQDNVAPLDKEAFHIFKQQLQNTSKSIKVK